MVTVGVSATDTESVAAPSGVTVGVGDRENITDGFLTPGKFSNLECFPGIIFHSLTS